MIKIIFTTLFLSTSLSSWPSSCNYLMMSSAVVAAVEELKEAVDKVPLVKLDPKFCKAMTACEEFEQKLEEENELKEAVDFLKGLPELKAKIDSQLAEAEKKFNETNPDSPENIKKISVLKVQIKSLKKSQASAEKGLKVYQEHQKSPLKYQKLYAYQYSVKELSYENAEYSILHYENSYAKTLEQTKAFEEKIAATKKIVEELKKAEKPVSSDINYHESTIGYYQKAIDSKLKALAIYQEYIKDPKNLPYPMGLSIPLKEEPEIIKDDTFEEDDEDEDDKKSDESICENADYRYQSLLTRMSSKKMGSCKMSPEEMVAISYYTDDGYSCMNSYLRKEDQKDENINFLVETMNSGLSKLPSYKGLVKRGGKLPESVKAKHTPGSIVTYGAYTSSSTSNGFSAEDMFLIYSKNGKPIMGLSSHSSEYEVLFKSNSQFKVIDVWSKENHSYYILKEVSEGSSPEEEAKADKLLIDSLKGKQEPSSEKSKSTTKPETWSCPMDEKEEIPKFIQQISSPVF